MKNILNNKTILITTTLLVGLAVGWLIKPSTESKVETDNHDHVASVAGIPISYTCSMHPQIRQNEPGDCPICGMDLIPLESESTEADPMSITMSATALQLANVHSMVVGNLSSEKSIRLSGKIQADERQNYSQSAHISGRIEDLTVNFTGEYVSKGQVLGQIYCPELATAQEELFQSQKIRDTQPVLYNAAREKLKNWKFTDGQIDQLLAEEKVTQQVPILANVSGYVTEKLVNLGDYVTRGAPIYQIVDLSKVWVLFDVYESELQWVKKGDNIEFTVQSLPGETFTGKISYLDPIIDSQSRVAKARVEVQNTSLKFKPEMFVSGIVKSESKLEGNAMAVPKTAVMWTGTRSIVYVKSTTNQSVSFKLREVTLGAALGDSYVIESGLKAGDEIAVNGTFSIDAAAQLAGKPSMMSPEGGAVMSTHDHGGMAMPVSNTTTGTNSEPIPQQAKDELKPLFNAYFGLKDALTKDDFKATQVNAEKMKMALSNINMTKIKGDTHVALMRYQGNLKASLDRIGSQNSLDEIRKSFLSISDEIVAMAQRFHPYPSKIYVQHCPMADSNRGADWLSLEEKVVNPYFGNAMLTCGEVTKTIP